MDWAEGFKSTRYDMNEAILPFVQQKQHSTASWATEFFEMMLDKHMSYGKRLHGVLGKAHRIKNRTDCKLARYCRLPGCLGTLTSSAPRPSSSSPPLSPPRPFGHSSLVQRERRGVASVGFDRLRHLRRSLHQPCAGDALSHQDQLRLTN